MIGVITLTMARKLNSNLASSLMFGTPLVGLEWCLWLQNGQDHSYNQWTYFFLLGWVTSPCIVSLILLALVPIIVPSVTLKSSGSTSRSCCPWTEFISGKLNKKNSVIPRARGDLQRGRKSSRNKHLALVFGDFKYFKCDGLGYIASECPNWWVMVIHYAQDNENVEEKPEETESEEINEENVKFAYEGEILMILRILNQKVKLEEE